ncbi:MAG: ATP-binding protein [Oscillospiraceae bacterium]|nr:ATP-binding protein [Oscillospiraceae bacterium]
MIIGREAEKKILRSALTCEYSEFIAVYGRRRIGKTFLVREAYNYRFTFQHAGQSKGNMKTQLRAFEASLKDAGYPVREKASNWMEAFECLKDLIRTSTEKKKVIFLDELSWMDTPRSDMVAALEDFWNGWASARKDVVLIVCASATSWMLSKIIHNKGGLYNRLTNRIHLKPFCLGECEMLAKETGLVLDRTQLLQYYMIFGGVPYYWNFLQKGQSIAQNIDRILFSDDAPLRDEFSYLYASIFKNPEGYLKIIQALSTKKAGLTRNEIIEEARLINSGDLTAKLNDLENCGFIRQYLPIGKKKKDAIYQLIDAFTLYHYHFMSSPPSDAHFWSNQINTPAINTWLGLAFEKVCLLHVQQMKKSLGISGVLTNVQSFACKADADSGLFGSHIDLLIERNDHVVNLCEMKYSNTEYTLSQKDWKSIQNKIHDLLTATGTKNAIYPTLVTPYGLMENSFSGIIQNVITLDDLFVMP